MILVPHKQQSARSYSLSRLLIDLLGALALLLALPPAFLDRFSSRTGGLAVVCATMSTTDVYEWSVRIRMDRNALGGAFAVAVFALPPEEQAKQENVSSTIPARPSQWKDSPYYVGQVAALPTSLEPTGENQDPVMTQGFVSLDDALDVFLGSSDMQTVVQYMRSALVWKISSAAKVVGETLDEEVDLDKLPSLEVEVLSRKLENGLVQGPAVRHPEITQDKRGGATVA